MSNGKYEVSVDRVKKVVKVVFKGMLECSDGDEFFGVYAKATSGVPKKDYNILVNCREMGIFKPELLPYMKQGYLEYDNYRHIHIIESDKAVVNMQFKRIAKELNLLDRISIVKDEKDVKFV